ncbi:hypothetical protein BN3590_00781 [Clostridium sp. C105KSO15]|nr:hypothetical protein BN3590_00781 [Clostridium sp. C105KSO15]
MNKDTFWRIIDEVNSETDQNNQSAILKETEKKLLAFSSKDIIDWHNIKKMYMDLAYRNDLWAACAATQSHSTDDGFIDFRSWLISRGKEVYMDALNDPDTLAEQDFPIGTADFESYGYVAHDCYAIQMAMESKGLNSFLLDYSSWLAENSATLNDFYECHPKKGVSNEQRITAAYLRALSQVYDIYNATEQQLLCEETTAEIMAEIKIRPDIDPDWSIDNLPQMLPRLCEKYNVEEMHDDMDFNMK